MKHKLVVFTLLLLLMRNIAFAQGIPPDAPADCAPPPVPEACVPPPLPMHGKDCPKPGGCCYPEKGCSPYCNPYAPPPEDACCPPAPIRGTSCGISVVGMVVPIILVAGVAAIILSLGEGETAHSH